VALHCFLQEFQCRLLFSRLRHETFEDPAPVIARPPQIVPPTLDLPEHLVEVPGPLWPGPQPLRTFLADLGGELRAETLPPEPHRLVADLGAALVKQVLDVPEREREPDIEHDRETNDFRAAVKILERVACRHGRTLR